VPRASDQNADKVVTTGGGQARLVARAGEVDYVVVIDGQRVVRFFAVP
jgi:hypothetical protein